MNFLSPGTTCPFCNQEGKLIEEGLIDKPERNYYICLNCEFAWQHPLPSQEDILKYYESEYREDGPFSYKNPQEYYEKKVVTVRQRWEHLKDYFGSGQQVIDFGCGTGGWMEQLASAGCHVSGVEPYQPYAEYARKFGPVKQDYLETIVLPQKYDSFCLFHILEHLRHPDQMLLKLKEFALEGSRLFIEVPNLQDAFNTGYIFPKELKRFISPHLWTFAPRSLEKLLEETGWTVTRTIPYQRISFFTHFFHAMDKGQTMMEVQKHPTEREEKKFMIKVTGVMEQIYKIMDFNYRRMLVENHMSDTLLIVAVNA